MAHLAYEIKEAREIGVVMGQLGRMNMPPDVPDDIGHFSLEV